MAKRNHFVEDLSRCRYIHGLREADPARAYKAISTDRAGAYHPDPDAG